MQEKQAWAGSGREPFAGAVADGAAEPQEPMTVSILLRRRSQEEFDRRMALVHAGTSVPALSRADFAREFGADPAQIAIVRGFAQEHGLRVVAEHAERRTVVLAGTVAQFNAAFGIQLQCFRHARGSYRGWTGPLQLPKAMHGFVESVLGLDTRPQARAHFRIRENVVARAASASFTPLQVAAMYGFPAGDGHGQTIAMIELGGGFTASDLASYFANLGIATPPSVVAVGVDGAANAPTGSASGPDGEVMLDIEVAGAIAPGASIAVYFAPNTDAGFLDAITTAVHDTTRAAHIVSISWGGPESSWSAQAMTSFDQAFQDAVALGVTVCVAAGDNGSSDGVASGEHVDFPASSPNVLACGGTNLQGNGSTIAKESVWNDGTGGGATGGGISANFALPTWQSGLSAKLSSGASETLAKRGVPDVAGDADPQSGYNVLVDGQSIVVGGTSAVAPLWSALIARINGARGTPVGFVNPALYTALGAFNDITQGNNGDFAAAKGWDACTGLGSPKGTAVLATLTK